MLMRLIPPLIAVALVAFFASLGFWQLSRGQEKQALFDGFERSLSEPPARLDGYAPQPRFLRVSVSGTYTEHSVLLENQPLDGRQGAFLLTPLRLETGQYLMVNRGWLALPRDRSKTPPLPLAPGGVQQVTGHLSHWPQPGIRLGEIDYRQPLPWRVPYLEPRKLAQALNLELAPQILLATDNAGGGLLQRWRPQVMAPERHRGYALQWFSLAAAVLVVTTLLQWRLYRK